MALESRGLTAFFLVKPGRHGDLAGDAFGQAAGHGLPVFLEEGPGHRHLHHRHGQDDDQQGPSEQPLGHDTLEEGHAGSVLEYRVGEEAIAFAADRLEMEGFFRVGLQLASQACDLDIDGALAAAGAL